MLDIGWAELGVIAVVALVVIGPRDLPRALHAVGVWVGRARGLVREFQQGMEDLAREAELEDLRKKLASAEAQMKQEASQALEPVDQATREFGQAFEPLPAPAEETAAGSVPDAPALPEPAGDMAIATAADEVAETVPAADTPDATVRRS